MNIDFKGIDPIKFIKEVYELSVPQGLGFLHFKEGELTEDEAKEILDFSKDNKMHFLDMDYIKGRACKMTVFREGKKLFFRIPWYDHTDIQSEKLLKAVWPKGKIFPKLEGKHGIACNCVECQIKRGC